MASDAFLGEAFVFQSLYLDDLGVPIAVISPTIKIFRFDASTGQEVVLVSGAPLTAVVPADPGRYGYRYVIPDSLPDGTVLYGESRATVPISLDVIVKTEVLNLKTRGTTPGLNVRFWR